MASSRLDKLIADKACVSRAEARALIKEGRVSVSGDVVRSAESKTDESSALYLDGKELMSGAYRYIMMNKPAGVITATDDASQNTVIDILPPEHSRRGMFPVGRLDKDTTGLLILTNDGDFCHRVSHPKKLIPKVYEVFSENAVMPEDADAFSTGLTLRDGYVCLPAKLKIDTENPRHSFIEIFEGKYHQVKRMFGARSNAVLSLRRVSIGGLELDGRLKEGEVRVLTKEEAASVFMK